MRSTSDATRRRATRLLSWYPREWRARYGEEFVELLVDDIAERPRSPWRALDVASSGVVARLATAGLEVVRSTPTIMGADRWLPSAAR